MKKFLPILGLFFLFFSLNAQSTSPAVEKTDAKDTPRDTTNNSLLWRISGNGLAVSSYLYGTIHMIGKEDFFLTDSTRSTFDRSEQVAFEINMEEMNDMSMVFSLMGKITMNGGTTLKDLMSAEDYSFVNKKFEELGLPMLFLDRIKPMFLSTFASGDLSGGMGSGEVVSYEMEFMEMATAQKKSMAGLETVEYQLSMFDSIPYEAQAQMLLESLKAEDTGNDQFAEMVRLYRAQDLEGMQQMFAADTEGIGKFEDILLANRNRNWIPVMTKMMSEKPTFFAVGAGHLGGEVGVIRLLRAAGFTVEAIR